MFRTNMVTGINRYRLSERGGGPGGHCTSLFMMKNNVEMATKDTTTMKTDISVVEDKIAVLQKQIAETLDALKNTQNQIVEIGADIKNTKAALENVSDSSKRGELIEDLKNSRDKEMKLMVKEATLMVKEATLMDEKAKLMEREAKLEEEFKLKKIEDMKAASASYLQIHKEWCLGGNRSISVSGDIPEFKVFQDFAELRIMGYMVDKSLFIAECRKRKFVVYRRPRRHGKTLFLSMLKYYFLGAVNLFNGMAVFNETHAIRSDNFIWSPWDPINHNFPPFPVVNLDFSLLLGFADVETFSRKLTALLKYEGETNNCVVDPNETPAEALSMLVKGLANQPLNQRKKVVILIDEYDAPLNKLSDASLKDFLEIYKLFFTRLKSLEQFIELVYVTGITSYGMTGIFSGANNFLDLTNDVQFESMCAFTEEEFRKAISSTRPFDPTMTTQKMTTIKQQYNGYSWNLEQPKNERKTYFNPYFVARYCLSGNVADFWSQTNSESLIIAFPALASMNLQNPSCISKNELTTPWIRSASKSVNDNLRLLFESGYLTVVDVKKNGTVLLDLPNEQTRKFIRSQYLRSLFNIFSDSEEKQKLEPLKSLLLKGKIIEFFSMLEEFRAEIPYYIAYVFKNEAVFEIFLLIALTLMNIEYICEETSGKGRSDLLFYVSNATNSAGTVYVTELKALTKEKSKSKELIQKSAVEAMEQIISKGYLHNSKFAKRHQSATKIYLALIAADVDVGTRRWAMLAMRGSDENDSQTKFYPIRDEIQNEKVVENIDEKFYPIRDEIQNEKVVENIDEI